MTLHRYLLNRHLARVCPLPGRVLEVGNGSRRRGYDTGATVTLDKDASRQPTVWGNALNMAMFDACEFDGVICCETLQYIPRYVNALREMRRVLKPRGHFIVSLPWKLPQQPDERPGCLRWPQWDAKTTIQMCGFTVTKISPLWPPLRCYTSGWFVEAVAV